MCQREMLPLPWPIHKRRVVTATFSGANLLSEPYEYRYGREGWVLTRPWHSWQFEIEGRRSMFDPSVRVEVYELRAENGEIRLTRQRSPRRITIVGSSVSPRRFS